MHTTSSYPHDDRRFFVQGLPHFGHFLQAEEMMAAQAGHGFMRAP